MDTFKFWAVFAVGVAAGAAVALIYAPQTVRKLASRSVGSWMMLPTM